MKIALLLLQIVTAISVIGLILLQNSKGGLQSGVGSGEVYRSKRGAEKFVFNATIFSSVLFFVVSIVNLIIK